MHLLWLASWYPDREAPTNGDFVQRHALAVSTVHPLTVIHVVQGDPGKRQEYDQTDIHEREGLREVIVHFKHRPWGIGPLDRIRYEMSWRRNMRKALEDHLARFGKPGILHVHVPLKAGWAALWLKKQFCVPLIVSEHSSEHVPGSPDSFWNRSESYRRRWLKVMAKAKLITNVSRTVAQTIGQLTGRQDVVAVPNTVDTELFRYEGIQPETFRFLHVSNLNEQKNISGLIRVFTAFAQERRDWELVLVGPVSEALRQSLVPLSGLVQVRCTGLVAHEQVAHEMKHASAFVLFSQHENFPCVNVEALCCGLPVITSTAGGAGEDIDASNGLTVAPGDEAALLDALRQMRSNHAQYDRSAIAQAAAGKYGYQAVAQQFLECYKKVLKKKVSS